MHPVVLACLFSVTVDNVIHRAGLYLNPLKSGMYDIVIRVPCFLSVVRELVNRHHEIAISDNFLDHLVHFDKCFFVYI